MQGRSPIGSIPEHVTVWRAAARWSAGAAAAAWPALWRRTRRARLLAAHSCRSPNRRCAGHATSGPGSALQAGRALWSCAGRLRLHPVVARAHDLLGKALCDESACLKSPPLGSPGGMHPQTQLGVHHSLDRPCDYQRLHDQLAACLLLSYLLPVMWGTEPLDS